MTGFRVIILKQVVNKINNLLKINPLKKIIIIMKKVRKINEVKIQNLTFKQKIKLF